MAKIAACEIFCVKSSLFSEERWCSPGTAATLTELGTMTTNSSFPTSWESLGVQEGFVQSRALRKSETRAKKGGGVMGIIAARASAGKVHKALRVDALFIFFLLLCVVLATQ